MDNLKLINLTLLSRFKEKIDVLLEKKVNKTDVATTEQLGLIKPDNSTVFVDENGVLSSVGGSGGGSTTTSLSDLTDVQLTSLANGQGLFYDGDLQKWVNGNVANSDESSNVSVSSITVMTQSEFDAIIDKSTLGIVGICDNGYEITKFYSCDGIISVFKGTYSDNSPVTYDIEVNAKASSIQISSSSLWQTGTVLCEALLDDSGTYTELFTDTTSSEGVWGGSSGGNVTYNKIYTFDEATMLYGLRLTFTNVFRVSCDVVIKK